MTVSCIMFSTLFQLYCGGQSTYPYFLGVLLTGTLHNVFPKPLAAFPSLITIVKTMNSSEREMNPFTITVINPWKE